MKRKVIFAAESNAQDRALQNTGERLVNMYPEPVSQEARSPLLLWNVPGMQTFTSAGTAYDFLDLLNVQGGMTYLATTSSATNTQIGGLLSNGFLGPGPSTGQAPDNNEILVEGQNDIYFCQNGVLRRWQIDPVGATIVGMTGGAFSNDHSSVTVLSGYVITSQRIGATTGRLFQWALEGGALDALNVATKEGRSDRIVRVMASQGRLYVMGERSFEVWYLTGQAGPAAFERVPGAVFDVGLRGLKLACEYEDRIWFLTDDGAFASLDGISVSPIRSPLLSEALAEGTPTAVFPYEDRGHKFVCIRFSDRPAVCYDLTTGLFHERSTGTALGAWDIVDTAPGYGKWHGYRSGSGALTFTRNAVDEASNGVAEAPLTRTIRSRPLELDGEIFRVPSLTLRLQPTDTAFDVTMKHSRDGGKTWTAGRTKSVATTSETGRLRFNSLGRARLFQVEVTMDDEAETVMEAAAIVDVA